MANVPQEESEAVLAFMASRRSDVLRRAIDTLATCSGEDLVAETHRLSGTLGSYQLTDAATCVRALHEELKVGSATDPEDMRVATLATLRQIAEGERA